MPHVVLVCTVVLVCMVHCVRNVKILMVKESMWDLGNNNNKMWIGMAD